MKTKNIIKTIKTVSRLFIIIMALSICLTGNAYGATPITLNHTYTGRYDFVGTGGSLRDEPNSVDACSLYPGGSSSALLSGIPADATIIMARLYWAGSYSTQSGSTRTTPDYDIKFEDLDLTADKQHTESVSFNSDIRFFAGEEDVTSIVTEKAGGPNGTYTFSDLSVNTGPPHCIAQNVVAGWSLVVIYEDIVTPAPVRTINIYDGFEIILGSKLTLTASGFVMPLSGADGKVGHITWEGDETIDSERNGFTENLFFQSQPLSDLLNPVGNQYNSTINSIQSDTSYGVDFDIYNVDSYLSGGETSVTTVYSTGQDLILLSAEIISGTIKPNLEMMKTKLTEWDPVNLFSNPKAIPGANIIYTIQAKNIGEVPVDVNTVVITDEIPANTKLYVDSFGGDECGPFEFIDGTPTSGLTCTFTNLSDPNDDVSFSKTLPPEPYNYIPIPDADGYDPKVTSIRINPQGVFPKEENDTYPNFKVQFRVRIE